jgi:histidinol phosphatase-like PHP family hydrolase
MTWQPVDCHAHSTLSDGWLTPGEVAERARQLGVRPSVTDHLSRHVQGAPHTARAVREYLDELEHWDVLRGGEFCWDDSLWRDLPDELSRRFTHRIGSVHAVTAGAARVRMSDERLPDGLTTDAYVELWLESAERLAAEMPVDVMAHPTLISKRLHAGDPDALWSEEREERLVEALYRGGIAFEISSRYPPHERIVRRAADRGVRLSLGSDGHRPWEVADVARPLALTRSLGVPDEELYDPVRHGSKVPREVAA